MKNLSSLNITSNQIHDLESIQDACNTIKLHMHKNETHKNGNSHYFKKMVNFEHISDIGKRMQEVEKRCHI